MMHESHPQNEVTYMFKAADIRKLLEGNPDYLLIKTSIEPRYIDNEAFGVVAVVAEAYRIEQSFLAKAKGCPVPPCVPS